MHLSLTLLVALLLPVIASTNFTKPTIEDESLEQTVFTNKSKKLTIGYLTAVKGKLKGRQGLTISGALTKALEEINNSTTILPGVTLELKWNDTKGETIKAVEAMIDMIHDGVAVFFGPEDSCYVEAIVAESKNIPMISYKCSDYKVSDIKTFARIEPPDTQVTKSVISLLNYYGWNKFSVIYEEDWRTVAYSLMHQVKLKNMTINDKKGAVNRHKCCEEKMVCCFSNYWYNVIQETKNRTRIYVFLGSSSSLVDFMNTMEAAQLFDNGEYMVVTVDKNTYSVNSAYKYLWNPDVFDKYSSCEKHQKDFLKRGRSLFVVVQTEPSKNYEDFSKIVREYNTREPFNFVVPTLLLTYNYQKFISIYAAYLYDSVMLYARALDKLLREQPFINNTIIDEVASNGTKIIETIIGLRTYTSVTGAVMQLDKNGDSLGNFSVLALKPSQSLEVGGVINFICPYQMVPIGQFQQGEKFPSYNIFKQVDWPGLYKPVDQPSCGFENELCLKYYCEAHKGFWKISNMFNW